MAVINNTKLSLSGGFFDLQINGVFLKNTLAEIDDLLEYFADKNITP
jgi:hypothetical protein